jgi:hypothetical protein
MLILVVLSHLFKFEEILLNFDILNMTCEWTTTPVRGRYFLSCVINDTELQSSIDQTTVLLDRVETHVWIHIR